MTRIINLISVTAFSTLLYALAIVPGELRAAPNTGGGAGLYDCGTPSCGAWKKTGEKTCQTCKVTQCEKRGGKEFIRGSKTTTKCEVPASSAAKARLRARQQQAPAIIAPNNRK